MHFVPKNLSIKITLYVSRENKFLKVPCFFKNVTDLWAQLCSIVLIDNLICCYFFCRILFHYLLFFQHLIGSFTNIIYTKGQYLDSHLILTKLWCTIDKFFIRSKSVKVLDQSFWIRIQCFHSKKDLCLYFGYIIKSNIKQSLEKI